jgi:hypothetical protein
MLTLEYIYDVELTFQFDDFHDPVMFDEYSIDITNYLKDYFCKDKNTVLSTSQP